MVKLGLSRLKKAKVVKLDPPSTRTPPLTPIDYSPSPPNHVMIRKRVESDDNDQMLTSNDSLISELSFPNTLTMNGLLPQLQQHDPPGYITPYSKADLDAVIRSINKRDLIEVPGCNDPPALTRSTLGESLVTRVLGIVDIGCVSPFADSTAPSIPFATQNSVKAEWGIPPSATIMDENDVLKINDSGSFDCPTPRVEPDAESVKQEQNNIVCVTPDEKQQAHLQLHLPSGSPKMSRKRPPASPSRKGERKSNWIANKFKPKSKNETKGSLPSTKIETILGISPVSSSPGSFSEKTALKMTPTKQNVSPKSSIDDRSSGYEEKKVDYESRINSVQVSPFVDPSEYEMQIQRQTSGTMDHGETMQQTNDRRNKPNRPELKGSGRLFRKAFQQITKKDNESSHTMETLKMEANPFQVDQHINMNGVVKNVGSAAKSPELQEGTSVTPTISIPKGAFNGATKTGNEGQGVAPRVRKVLKSIKTAPTEQLETVDEAMEDELSCSTTGSDLRVRIPGVHIGSPDAYIRGKDLIGDEFVEENGVVPDSNEDSNEDDEINRINKFVADTTSDEIMGDKGAVSPLQVPYRVENTSRNVEKVSKVVGNKVPFVESRHALPPVTGIRPTSPKTDKRGKSWKEYLQVQRAESQSHSLGETDSGSPHEAEMLRRHFSSPAKTADHSNDSSARLNSSPQRPPKAMWRAVLDPTSGRTYYYHRKTRETTWTRPPDNAIIVDKPRTKSDKNESILPVVETEKEIIAEPSCDTKQTEVDPESFQKKEEIVKTLIQNVKPPNKSSVDNLIQQYDGREDELMSHIRDLSESRPFDEPIQSSSDIKSTTSKALPTAPSSLTKSGTLVSFHSGFSGNLSSSTRISETTQQVRNTTYNKPAIFAPIQEGRRHLETLNRKDSPSPVLQRSLPSYTPPIPINIPVPRTRELAVEEFTTRDPLYGVKESEIRERQARVLQRQRNANQAQSAKDTITYNSIDPNAYLGDIEDPENDKATASVGHTDSVSALSEADLSFVTRLESLELTRRRALHDALAQKDWDRAADISEIMRMDYLRLSDDGKRKVISSVDYTHNPLDRFVSVNDWDAVATYIAQVRAKDLKMRRQIKNPEVTQRRQKLIVDTVQKSNSNGRFSNRTQMNRPKVPVTTPTHLYHVKDGVKGRGHGTVRASVGTSKDDNNSYSSYSSYSSYTSEYTSGSYYSDDDNAVPAVSRQGKREFAC